ncbi:MAG: amidase [Halobacteriota archaeon]
MSEIPPTVRPPTRAEIREYASAHYIDLTDEEVEDFHEFLTDSMTAYERLDELTEPRPKRSDTVRDPGYRPSDEEDPHNAVVTACEVRGADDGPLAGYTVGLKDSVQLAGVEMTCGSSVFRGYHPSADATVATRLLDAGATITAKLNMEAWAVSSTGDQSLGGPVLNPRDTDYLAGGSSGGSAAAVVTGQVDIAVGTDQAGSIRMPAAMCGCVGLKPTHGLVPYTGIVAVAPTVDHAGPMTRTVTECALALDVMAGEDPSDPRSISRPEGSYVDALDDDPSGVTVGVLAEGFGLDVDDGAVDATVRDALDAFAGEGATLEDVSVPLHRDGMAIRNAVVTEAGTALVDAEGVGHFVDGWYDTEFAEAFGRARRVHADDFPLNLKLRLVLGAYLADEYLGYYHAKAQNLSRRLALEYDDALSGVDVLAMPTMPKTALRLKESVTRTEWKARSKGAIRNTSPFNVSGHPAISVPCGTANGLPVGMMFVGRRNDDGAVLRAAYAFEQHVNVDLDG